jgi:AcrR family transcriptional regulator
LPQLQVAPKKSPFPSREGRAQARQLKREAVLAAAASLFCQRGYDATQMADVARLLGVTKPVIYYYFRNKEDVLVACFEVGFEQIEATLRRNDVKAANGAERLRSALRAYALIMTEDFGKCTARIPTGGLSEVNRKLIRTHRRKFDKRIRLLVKDAIADGSMSACDPKLATFTILGSINWIGFWHQPDGEWSAAQIAESIVDQLFRGFENPKARTRTS